MKTIVICDDSPMVRKLIAVAMRDCDYRILIAEDGQEGLQLSRSEKPDLVVTDLAMPNMNGVQLFDALRLEPDLKSIPVIFLTALTGTDLIGLAQARPVHSIIAKPFSPGELRAQIAAVFES